MELYLSALAILIVGFVLGNIACAFIKNSQFRDMHRELREMRRRVEELEGRGK